MKRRRTKPRARKLTSCEHRSDRRTVEFVASRLGELQEGLADLIPDMRSLEHYSEIEDVSWCLRTLQHIKRKYENYDVGREWDE